METIKYDIREILINILTGDGYIIIGCNCSKEDVESGGIQVDSSREDLIENKDIVKNQKVKVIGITTREDFLRQCKTYFPDYINNTYIPHYLHYYKVITD